MLEQLNLANYYISCVVVLSDDCAMMKVLTSVSISSDGKWRQCQDSALDGLSTNCPECGDAGSIVQCFAGMIVAQLFQVHKVDLYVLTVGLSQPSMWMLSCWVQLCPQLEM